jgi:hypothetical protein
MSDTDAPDDGDGGFDKEAEREKLREKYEANQARREATQQMSELLLKGATMTDHHCDDCGSPIFRYEGEAFCPTCAGTRGVEGEGDQQQGGQQQAGQGEQAGQGGQQQGGQQQAGQGVQAGQGGQQASQRGAGEAGQQPPRQQGGQRPGRQQTGADRGQTAGGDPRLSGDAHDESGEDASAPSGDDGELDESDLEAARKRLDERTGSRPPEVGGPGTGRPDPPVGDSPVRQGEVPSMAQTRASLRRAIVSLSEQAAQSDDPNRAHDLLQGAREASEALAALEGTTGE